MNGNERVLFANEARRENGEEYLPWKILIADDEDEVHAITRMVLDSLTFEGRRLQFFSAYSGAETIALLQQHPDMAVLLLDVVMEEETTGLRVARYIRKDLANQFVRIVLRTGQPGQAPEKQVTMDYDIDDYKEKTELTVPKLFTTVIGALRAYRDLRIIEKSRKGLEQIIAASAQLFELQTLENFAAAILSQLTLLLSTGGETVSDQPSGFIATRQGHHLSILAGIGGFQNMLQQSVHAVVSEEIWELLNQAQTTRQNIFAQNQYTGYFCSRNGSENWLYLQSRYHLNAIDQELIRVFSNNIAIAFDNIYLNQSIISTQKEVIFTLGQVIETRGKETGNHVKRVAAYSYTIALNVGISKPDAELLRLASPLHDVGKIGIPDAILNKPGKLSEEEYQIVKLHPTIGYNILKDSKQSILKTGAIIAWQHHENWDGSGYPQKLSGVRIHILARITKLAEIFDMLSHHRIYAEAWDMERILTFLRAERARQFDPALVDLFFAHLAEFLAIHEAYPDDKNAWGN